MAAPFVDNMQDADILTHSGDFHADDIFCIAFFWLLWHYVKCYRVKRTEQIPSELGPGKVVFDVGKGKYDHHQKGGNGFHKLINKGKEPIPYASFGLIWKDYGMEFIKRNYPKSTKALQKYLFNFVEHHLCRSIDAGDNGIFPQDAIGDLQYRVLTHTSIVSGINPWDDEDREKCAVIAIQYAKRAIKATLELGKQIYEGSVSNGFLSHKKFNAVVSKCIDRCYRKVFAYTINKRHHQFVEDQLQYFFNGFRAEVDGKRSKYNANYDSIGMLSFADVFCDALFDADAQTDLNDIFNIMFDHTVETIRKKIDSKKILLQALKEAKDKRVVVLDEKIPWGEFLTKLPGGNRICFVITPTRDGLWKLRATSKNDYSKELKAKFPEEWLGYSEEDEEISELKDIIFIHQNGIMALAKTKEAAFELALKTLARQKTW